MTPEFAMAILDLIGVLLQFTIYWHVKVPGSETQSEAQVEAPSQSTKRERGWLMANTGIG